MPSSGSYRWRNLHFQMLMGSPASTRCQSAANVARHVRRGRGSDSPPVASLPAPTVQSSKYVELLGAGSVGCGRLRAWQMTN